MKKSLKNNSKTELILLGIMVTILEIVIYTFPDYNLPFPKIQKIIYEYRKSKISEARSELATIRKALDIYYAESPEGYPAPDKVAAVLQEYGISWTGNAMGIADSWNNTYEYSATPDGDYFVVTCKGPDGINGTEDDIYITDSVLPTVGNPPPCAGNNKRWVVKTSKSYRIII